MSRLHIQTTDFAGQTVEKLYKDLERRIVASPPGLCPVDLSLSFLQMCQAQTCGKCAPCRIGLDHLRIMITKVLDGGADLSIIDDIQRLAESISCTADCAVGYEAARMILRGLEGFRDDYEAHIKTGHCTYNITQSIPCISLCPAGVDIPGYIALVDEDRCADAVRLIRRDNPFPTACALICEHPCEARCRRNMLDSSVNIRGIKRYACDNAGTVAAPSCASSTGKRIAVIGGGPSGLSAAFYLQLMGHQTTVFEKKSKLGGMLRYGIPSYRFPRERLQEDIDCILSTGVEVKYNVSIGQDITISSLREQYDAVYIAIGAHTDKKVGIEGEDGKGVISAVEMLGRIGDDDMPDFTGKDVVVIGGGNVAMDCVRSAIRLGAKSASVAYRRRKEDMTALTEEIEAAIAEGAELRTLMAPYRIDLDENGHCTALWVKPQIIGKIDPFGRASVRSADTSPVRLKADVIIVAVGQGVESQTFEESGVPVIRGTIQALSEGVVPDLPGVFAGGDCVTGPATVIRAIAAGKVAAGNIDEYLGYRHDIQVDIRRPDPHLTDKPACGRVDLKEITVEERRDNFLESEYGMTAEEVCQECSRCLRCDKFGYGTLKGGHAAIW